MQIQATDIAEFRAAQAAIGGLAVADLRDVWAPLNLSNPERVRDALLQTVPAITTQWGETSAVIAAEWYGDMRADAGVVERYSPRMAEVVAAVAAEQSVRFSAAHLWTANPGQMLLYLEGAVTKFAMQPGRDTITENVEQDPDAVSWRRMASPDACAYCAYMVTIVREGNPMEQHEKYHPGCRCTPVPVFEGQIAPWQVNAIEWADIFDRAADDINVERQKLPGWHTMRRPDRSKHYPEYQITTKNILARARRIAPHMFRDGVRA